MGWIDNEIDNYYVLKNRWEMNQSSENGQYCFNIEKVDRTDIGYDKDQFVPDNDMKFVLNQSKILELLMAIQLYEKKTFMGKKKDTSIVWITEPV